MKLSINTLALSLLLAPKTTFADECVAGSISIAGSSTVLPVAEAWATAFQSECPQTSITTEGGGSSAGAARVCANTSKGSPVDIGDMSRGWKSTEASTVNGWKYNCLAGDKSRSAIQIDVAIDGIAVITTNSGDAKSCIDSIGGLTPDQLRWIFSSFSESELVANGWDPSSVPNSDGNDGTHRWSELSRSCASSEIMITGADSASGTYEYFAETILPGPSETFRASYVENEEADATISYLQSAGGSGIAYFGYAKYLENAAVVTASPIKNSAGEMVVPNPDTVGGGSYNPLARRIYMNVLDDEDVLEIVEPFIEFGFSDEGSDLVAGTGYVPLPMGDKIIMLSRVGAHGGVDLSSIECSPYAGVVEMAGSSTVYPLAKLWYDLYSQVCYDTEINIAGGGSSAGAGRVCANPSRGSPVDIGNMSREWKSSEAALASNGWLYECLNGPREVAQFPVAGDGISVIMQAGGPGNACVESLGGLTTDQLRWIFSSFSESELEADGWDSSSVPNSDGRATTHYWSELGRACPRAEIAIYGPSSIHGTYEFFKETILTGAGEDFRSAYGADADGDVVDQVVANGAAMGYAGYALYSANSDALYAAPIQNSAGSFVAPSPDSVVTGEYNPLSRNIYMNFNSDFYLALSLPYLEFGYSAGGDLLTNAIGYVPLSDAYDAEMKQQRITTLYNDQVWSESEKQDYWCAMSASIDSAGSSTVQPLMDAWKNAYTSTCRRSSISVEGGGSSTGAKRVCGAQDKVIIGNMSRDWKTTEAVKDGSKISCLIGDTSVTATQLPAALDGITVVTVKGSAADQCIQSIGGLTTSQLNSIFSDAMGGLQLLWSDISPSCSATPITMTGLDNSHGTHEFFAETILGDGESFAPGYVENEVDGIIDYLQANDGAISYLGYVAYEKFSDILAPTPIANGSGDFVLPSTATIADGSYNPLSRYIYINVDNAYMGYAYYFLQFAFSGKGSEIVEDVGYVPISLSSSLWQKTWGDIVSEAAKNPPRM